MFRQIDIMPRSFMIISAPAAPSLLVPMKLEMRCGGADIRKVVDGEKCQLNSLFLNLTARCVRYSPRHGVSALRQALDFPRQR